VVGPARRLTGGHVWTDRRWWNAYTAVVAVVVSAFVLVGEGNVVPGARLGAVAVIAVMGGWYLVVGRHLIGRESTEPRVWVFVVGIGVLLTAATALASAASFVLFAVVPLVYTMMPMLPGTAVMFMFNLVPSAVYLARSGDLAGTVAGPLPVAVLVSVASAAFAVWVDRVVRESTQRAGLIAELAASRAEVARLSHEAGTAAERHRIAGEIHDTIAQGLSSVVMLVQAAEADLDRDPAQARRHLDLAGRAARESLAEARALVAGLSPAQLSGGSLGEVLTRLAERFRDETGVPVTARVAAAGPLPTALEVVLLRAAQEGLANVRKHANATTVALDLAYPGGSAVLTVTDDGCGIGAGAGAQREPGFGLAGMRARVADVGGTLRLSTPPGGGTRLTVVVPA
jgi:signal transduction histidine kinase